MQFRGGAKMHFRAVWKCIFARRGNTLSRGADLTISPLRNSFSQRSEKLFRAPRNCIFAVATIVRWCRIQKNTRFCELPCKPVFPPRRENAFSHSAKTHFRNRENSNSHSEEMHFRAAQMCIFTAPRKCVFAIATKIDLAAAAKLYFRVGEDTNRSGKP